MNKINWTQVAVFVLVALLVFLVGISLLGRWGYGGWGMMGPGMMGGWGMMGPGMMSGWGFSPFGWIGTIFMWLIPVGFIVLTVLGIAWIVRTIGGGNNLATPTHACPTCGRGVQADWRNCPHCGATLAAP